MAWRERFKDYLSTEMNGLQQWLDRMESRHCEMWETQKGRRKDVTEEYTAGIRSRIAEIEQLLIEEGLS